MAGPDDIVDPPVFQGEHGALAAWNGVIAFFKKFRRPDGTTYGPADFVVPSDLAGVAGFLHAYTDQAVQAASTYVVSILQAQIAAALQSGTSKPAPPTITSVVPAVVSGVGQVTVAFTDGGDGNSAISDHNVRLYVNGVLSAIPIENGAASPIVVTGITLGATYTATVTSINAIGESDESVASGAFKADAVVPAAPTIISVNTSGTAADVFFSIPPDNGSPYTGFLATATSSDGGTTRTGTPTSFAASPIHIANLTAGKHYTIVVRSTNAIGNSPNSATSTSFLVGTTPPSNAAQTQLGMFTSEPNAQGVSFIRRNESMLNHHLFGVQINFTPAPGGVDNVWGCTSDSGTVAADGVSKCLGYDSQLHARMQPILDIPLAVGSSSEGFGNGFGLSAAQKINRLNNVENGTYDGTNSVISQYRDAAKLYLRDRNIATHVAVGSNGVNLTSYAGSGTLQAQSMPSLMPTAGIVYVDMAGGGVGRVQYTGISGNNFTGCTFLGRCAVGGGSGATTIATNAYIGSGTGFTDFVGRFGWEFDGDWMPWGARKPATYWNGSADVADNTASQAALAAQWLRTYKVVVDLFRSFGWDTFKADLTGDPTYFQARQADVITPLLNAGPTADGAGRYVDSMGLDVYDWDPTNAYNASTKTWVDPTAAWAKMLGYLNAHLTIARNAGLPVTYGEWAAVTDKVGSPTGGDNPTFIQGMFTFLNGLAAGWGAGQLAFHTYFDSNNADGNFALGTNKPNAKAKFINLFGA